MARIFQFGLATEAFLNLVGAVPFVLYPEWCLSFAVADRSTTGAPVVPPSSAVLWQIYGVLVLSLTVPLILCIPDSNTAAEKRRIVFQTLISGEILIEAILLWHIRQPEKSGFTLTSLSLSAFFLLPALSWHTFATYIKPGLMNSDRFPSAKPSKKTR
ncbi:hypothetical protein F4805DRAFT_296777 [Annulohypoxylon moriforme]|nr:hypothetical protein F4805DRAFT_296777 [Annulohypoxylon moriforme]